MTESIGICELGHVGLHVTDIDRMRSFYETTLGLVVSDVNPKSGAVFMTSRPSDEHHEILLVPGRAPDHTDPTVLQQLSWRADPLETLQRLHARIVKSGAEIVGVVTHGNAIAVYFLDPEGNTTEIYFRTGLAVTQPFRQEISLEGAPHDVLAESERLVRAHRGPQL